MQPVNKVPVREINSNNSGKEGVGTMKKPGPAYGGGDKGNKDNGGGVFRPLKGKM